MVAEVDKVARTQTEVIKHIQEMWDPFQQLLPEYNTELGVLIAMRNALDLSNKHDKDDFVILLRKRILYFEVGIPNVQLTTL